MRPQNKIIKIEGTSEVIGECRRTEQWKGIRRHRATSSGDTSFALSSTAPRLLRRRGKYPYLWAWDQE